MANSDPKPTMTAAANGKAYQMRRRLLMRHSIRHPSPKRGGSASVRETVSPAPAARRSSAPQGGAAVGGPEPGAPAGAVGQGEAQQDGHQLDDRHEAEDPRDAEAERPADLGGQHVERRLVELVDGVEAEQHDQREQRRALGQAERQPGGQPGPEAVGPARIRSYRPNHRRSPQGGPRVVDRTNREPSD